MRILHALSGLVVVGSIAIGCTTTSDAPSCAPNDRCAHDPLSCFCTPQTCPKLDVSKLASKCSGSVAWVARYDCADHVTVEWFDSMYRRGDVYDTSGVLIGHFDGTDTGLCTTKTYGSMGGASCPSSCTLMCGDPKARWPGNPPCGFADAGVPDSGSD